MTTIDPQNPNKLSNQPLNPNQNPSGLSNRIFSCLTSVWKTFSDASLLAHSDLQTKKISHHAPTSTSGTTKLSAKALIDGFKQRKLDKTGHWYDYDEDMHERDKSNLLTLMAAHNSQFSPPQGTTEQGFVERIDVDTNDKIFVRADIHSDLKTFIGQLDELKKQGLLDENYVCVPGFHMILLGDFCDRGKNDVEILSLLLELRRKNPTQVHLIRGNHEDVDVQRHYSEDGDWIEENRDIFSDCYARLPVAICVGDKAPPEEKKREFIHFSHGSIPIGSDISALLSSKNSRIPVSSAQQAPSSTPVSPKTKKGKAQNQLVSARTTLTQAQAEAIAQKKLRKEQLTKPDDAQYQWGEFGEALAPTGRGSGYIVPPSTLQTLSRANATDSGVVKFYMVGHVHDKKEYSVERKRRDETSPPKTKIIAEALPSANKHYMQTRDSTINPLQGLLLTVQPKVGDWKRQAMISNESGLSSMDPTTGTMYGG